MNTPAIHFSALQRAHWQPEDTQKARLVVEFVQLIMNNHDFEEIRRRQQGYPYKQHNRTIEDGIEGVIQTVSRLVKNSPEFSYDVKSIFVDGDHVILHSHATLKSDHRGNERQGMNIIDTWRIEDGHLVEHWDAVEGISLFMRAYGLLTGGNVRNQNGIF